MINLEKEINKKYNKLTVTSIKEYNGINSIIICKCDCGNIIETKLSYIAYGHKKSCGCINKAKRKHGKSQTKLYRIYSNMIARCTNTERKDYKYYGGKGVKVCSQWVNDFEVFYSWAYNNGYKNGLTIDRIDVNKGYNPNNCRWVTKEKQSVNKTNTKYITFKGKTQSLKEWSEELNMPYSKLQYRVCYSKMSIEKAFTKP